MNQILEGKTVAALTLGCKVNMYDTQAMVEILENHGCSIVDFDKPADIYLINTCTVTNLGDKKSRQALRRARRVNPEAVIVACGCYAQINPDKVKEIEGVSMIIGTQDRMRIAEFICQYLLCKEKQSFVGPIDPLREFEELSVNTMTDKTRAYLKIQEGCDRYCTYCIIPYARGPVRSRLPESVLEEARRLSENEFKEIVLTGIHVASYGKDIGDTNLCQILKRVHEIDGIRRIRLSSIEPNAVTTEFLETIGALPKICDHFHLSLQSGSDKILKAMNRRYSTGDYLAAVENIRRLMPGAGITTDMIVGFPEETDEDFGDSLAFVKAAKLSRIHVFPYSPKTGTKAALMDSQTPPLVKDMRAKTMGEAGACLSRSFAESCVGKPLSVLFERSLGGDIYEGHTTNYIPLRKKSMDNLENRILTVIPDSVKDGVLYDGCRD